MATGLSISTTSGLSNGQKILVAAAMVAFEPAAPGPSLVMNKRIPAGHKQWDIGTYARLSTANALTEGVDLSQIEQLVQATLQVTPTEHGIIATLSKRLIRSQGDSDVVSTTGAMLGSSLRRRQDLDIIALFDGFSKTTPGASLAIDVTTFRGIVAYLLTDNDSAYGPAPMPLRADLHIEQISDIILDITDTTPRGTTTGISGELLARWWRGNDRLYGVEVFHGGNITRDSTGDSKGAIFNEGALAMVEANESESTEQDDNSLRAIEYGLFHEWGEGERADTHGVEVHSDTSTTLP
jgi:hypothetical protein